jgi:hypothetical protein
LEGKKRYGQLFVQLEFVQFEFLGNCVALVKLVVVKRPRPRTHGGCEFSIIIKFWVLVQFELIVR